MTFDEAVAAISSLSSRGWRLGLDRMQEFLRRAGLDRGLGGDHPPRYIHVAGTNGKGSVTAFLQSLLVEQGWQTGAAYSPYVYDVRERVQIGRNLIDRETFARLTARLWSAAESLEATELGGPTEFEFKTALGFAAWQETDCDWVALEVGLGGRLDATNVIDPACSVIVSIGMDHAEILGDTLGAIAREKAGILKPGRPAVVGCLPEEALDAVRAQAREVGSRLFVLGEDFACVEDADSFSVELPDGRYEGLRSGLAGRIQPHNAAVGIAALWASGAVRDPSRVTAGIEKAWLPGRMERRRARGVDWLLDGAHNPDAARELARSVEGPVVLLTGMVTGHEVKGFYERLAPLASEVHVAPIDFHRARDPFELAAAIDDLFPPVHAYADLATAVEAAARASEGRMVLVTGSFYLVGEVGRLLAGD